MSYSACQNSPRTSCVRDLGVWRWEWGLDIFYNYGKAIQYVRVIVDVCPQRTSCKAQPSITCMPDVLFQLQFLRFSDLLLRVAHIGLDQVGRCAAHTGVTGNDECLADPRSTQI